MSASEFALLQGKKDNEDLRKHHTDRENEWLKKEDELNSSMFFRNNYNFSPTVIFYMMLTFFLKIFRGIVKKSGHVKGK